MKRRVGTYFLFLTFINDLAMVNLASLLAYRLRFQANIFSYDEWQPYSAYLGLVGLQMIILPLVFALQGLYRPKRAVSWTDEFYAIFVALSIATVLMMAASAFASRDFAYSRLLLALAWFLSIILVTMGRFVLHSLYSLLRSRGIDRDRVLIMGTGETAQLILDKIRSSPGLGYHVVGFLSEDQDVGQVAGVPVLGQIEQLGAIIRSQGIDEIIIAIPNLSHKQLLDLVAKSQGARVGIKVFPDLFQMMASEVSIGDLNGLPLISVKDVALRGWNLTIKRMMDLVSSAVGLILLSPLMLLITALIKVTSPGGPVFYTQERVGLDGKPFQMLKFRSMRPGAEDETGPVWAKKGDPRTTRWGAFLRRFSLDELPQLINVLIGEMSLVGPRPERPYFVEQFQRRIPRYVERHNEKAGITGWAQVNGLRGDTSIEERTAYDLWYVENWTIWLDFKILIRSLLVILGDKNAY
ncbi:MAG: undecaprenyl-phosphate glucose phosphotransferase [Chloroflexi bacterium]|nr:undecaprenyl-phosphate glucose phosphotransferase [Chloroflexota bacterium]MCL5075334.1 undecaprenyl-phosphate glucose phosphotransferase [Chloroflexota bacterium]